MSKNLPCSLPQREFELLRGQLTRAQLYQLEQRLETQRAANRQQRRWWLLYPTYLPPDGWSTLKLWAALVGLFALYNGLLAAGLLALALHGPLPPARVVPLYLSLALPIALAVIVHLARLLHLPAQIGSLIHARQV